MPLYVYEGRDLTGHRVNGEIEAIDIQTVFNILKGRRITPQLGQIRPKSSGLRREIKIPGLEGQVSQKEVAVFTRQFATMLDSGLPIVQSLEVLARQQRNKKFKKILHNVRETVETGGTLSHALRKESKAFDELYIHMVTAGESGGMLDSILERLSVHMEKSIKLKREVKTAMIYPSIVVLVALIVTAVLLVFVIPTFKDLYDSSSMQLPGLTRFVIEVSDFMARSWHWIFGAISLMIMTLAKGLKTQRGQALLHPFILKLPLLGGIVKKVCVARFTRTLGTMIRSGVPILEALAVCSQTAGNRVIEHEITRARNAISEGQPFAYPLQSSKVFSPMVVQMISVGESTGALDSMLIKVAEFFEQEVDSAVAALKQSIEPVMILVIGAIVGVLVVAMYLPVFEMGKLVGL